MTEEEHTNEVPATGSETRIQGIARRVLTVDPNRLDMVFTGALMLFIGSLILMSFDLTPNARMVPLVVAVPTFILLSVIMSMLVSERVSNFADHYAESSLLGVNDEELGGAEETSEEEHLEPEEKLYRQRKRQVIAFSSIISLVLLVYLVGFMAAIPIFLIVLYRVWARQGWLVTIGTTIIVWLFIYVVFYIFLGARLFTGVFDINIVRMLPF